MALAVQHVQLIERKGAEARRKVECRIVRIEQPLDVEIRRHSEGRSLLYLRLYRKYQTSCPLLRAFAS